MGVYMHVTAFLVFRSWGLFSISAIRGLIDENSSSSSRRCSIAGVLSNI